MRHARGFTLIELMITVVIVAILAAVAIPSFREQVAKTRRSDAVAAMARVQLALEAWRAECPTYATNATCLDPDGDGTNNRTYPALTATDYYTLSFSVAATGTGYTLLATPSGSQAGDRCGNISFAYASGTVTKASSTSASNCGF